MFLDTTIFSSELGPDERLLWAGQPRPGLLLRASDAYLIPFSLLWGGFAIFWEASTLIGGAPSFFTLFGIPFVLIGLYVIAGRFFVDAAARGRTYYAVTDQRVIILSGLFNRNVRSLSLRMLADMSLSLKANGSGTITFGPTPPMAGLAGSGWPGAGQYAAPAFELIENARQVHELIRQAQQTAA